MTEFFFKCPSVNYLFKSTPNENSYIRIFQFLLVESERRQLIIANFKKNSVFHF